MYRTLVKAFRLVVARTEVVTVAAMGVTWSYNGFADFTALKAQSGIDDMVRNHVGFVFNVTF